MHSTSRRSRFTNQNRLPNAAAYKHVFASSNRGISGDFKWFTRRNEVAQPRLGIAVPKRHIRTAVRRNRLKRIIRESFRLQQDMLLGVDVVIVVRRQITRTDINLGVDLKNIWNRVSETV